MEYITTKPGRLSFPFLFTARPGLNGGDAKFSTNLLFDGDVDLAPLTKLVKETVADAYPSGKLPKGFKMAMQKQDNMAAEGSAGYVAGHYVIKASTKRKPTIVDRNMKPITDESLIYPGCWARLSVRPYCYDMELSKGLTFELASVQFLADGEPLAGGPSAEQAFADDDDIKDIVGKAAPSSDLPGGDEEDESPGEAKRSAIDDLM